MKLFSFSLINLNDIEIMSWDCYFPLRTTQTLMMSQTCSDIMTLFIFRGGSRNFEGGIITFFLCNSAISQLILTTQNSTESAKCVEFNMSFPLISSHDFPIGKNTTHNLMMSYLCTFCSWLYLTVR